MFINLGLALITISSITLRRDAIHKQTADRSHWDSQYDYIVVGAGSAGCVVANRLSADHKHTVLLLEAGGPQSAILNDIPGMAAKNIFPYSPKINIWKYKNVKQKYAGKAHLGGKIIELKGKVLGGSSAMNAMIYNRGNRRDFDNWVETYGAYGWSYAEVLPLFIKSENNSDQNIIHQNPGYHGTDGPLGVSTPSEPPEIILKLQNTYNELGFKTIDINGAEQTGTAIVQSTIKDGLRSSTANAYIDPNPFPNTLHILTKSFATKILFRKSMNKLIAFGVEFNKDNQLHRVVANKEVIVSAGPINSPQILMLSGIGPKDHLNSLGIEVIADLPVGNNYANHVIYPIVAKINDEKLSKPIPDLSEDQLLELYYNKSGLLSQFPISILNTNTANNVDKNWSNIQLFAVQLALFEWKYLILFSALGRVRSKGTVRLKSTDPFDEPLIDPQFLTHPQDFEDLVEATKFAYFVLKSTSFAKYISFEKYAKVFSVGCKKCSGQPIYQCDQWIRCLVKKYAGSFYHPVGSCRMGSVYRSDVVVDERLRVKDVFNVRVCDSSIFPEIINGNTNAATIMVGEKCAHIIREEEDQNRF